MAQLTPENMWAMYVDSLSKANGIPSVDNLMLAGTALPAQLNTETRTVDPIPVEQALAQVFGMGSNLPVWAEENGEKEGLFYTRSITQLFNQYSSFIRSILLEGDPDPAVKAKLNKDKSELDKATDEYFALYTQALDQYKEMGEQFPSFEAFLKQTPWGRRLQQADAATQAAQEEYDQTMRQAYGDQFDQLSRALTLIRQVESEMITGQGSLIMQVEDDTGKFPVPRISPSLLGQGGGTGYSAWLDQAIEAAANKQPPEVQISVKQGQQQYSYDRLTFAWEGKVSYFPFIWFRTKGKYEEVKVNTESSRFAVDISVQSVTTVTLEPGQWFMGDFLTRYREPSDFFATSPFAKKDIWGPGGLFNTVPTSLVIGFRPSVKATFDADSYSRLKRDWESSSTLGFGIGAFHLGAGLGASGSKDDARWDDESHSVSFTDKTTVPKIIGVTSHTPNYPAD